MEKEILNKVISMIESGCQLRINKMKCFLCKKQINLAVRHFIKARNKREKSNFRDLCQECHEKQMIKAGLVLIDGIWCIKK